MGRTALVTGASAGMGWELARLFAADGHDVVLLARRRDRLEALARELRERHHVTVRLLEEDLADPAAPARVHAALQLDGVEVEFLVNNAGFGTHGKCWELPLERDLAQVQVNLVSLFTLTRLFLPAMVARGSGRILNMGSTAGFLPGPFMATYYATKAFVNSFTEALSYELRGTGVTATVSCPGATATEFAGMAGTEGSVLFRLGAATAADVAREAYDAMMAGDPIIVHGVNNKLAMLSLRLGPRAINRAAAALANQT